MILSNSFSSDFAFPLFLKQPVTLSCGFPRFGEVATVKASDHKDSFFSRHGRSYPVSPTLAPLREETLEALGNGTDFTL
jgi:hypothetical protein